MVDSAVLQRNLDYPDGFAPGRQLVLGGGAVAAVQTLDVPAIGIEPRALNRRLGASPDRALQCVQGCPSRATLLLLRRI